MKPDKVNTPVVTSTQTAATRRALRVIAAFMARLHVGHIPDSFWARSRVIARTGAGPLSLWHLAGATLRSDLHPASRAARRLIYDWTSPP